MSTQRRKHAPRDTADKPGHTATATWTQNQMKTTKTCQDINTARHTGIHQKSHTNKQVSGCTQLTDTHGKTSRTPTQHQMGHQIRLGHPQKRKGGDTRRWAYMQTQTRIQIRTYKGRHTHTSSRSKIQIMCQSHLSLNPSNHLSIHLLIHSSFPSLH